MLSLRNNLDLLRHRWTLSSTSRTGSTKICHKLVSITSAGLTFGLGLMRVCLYRAGYFPSIMLEVIMQE